MHCSYLLAVLTVAFTAACGTEEVSPTEGRVQNSNSSRALDTLLFLLTVKAENDELPYVASMHVMAVEFEIDGIEWGTFAPTIDQDADGPSSGWAFTNEPDPAFIVARVGSGTAGAKALETVGDWVGELQRRLRPGDHVARIIRVQLDNGEGEIVTIEPNILLPFNVAPGEASAWIADLVVTMPAKEVTK